MNTANNDTDTTLIRDGDIVITEKRTIYCKSPEDIAIKKQVVLSTKRRTKKHKSGKGELNPAIWDIVFQFKQHWDCIKMFKFANKKSYPLEITDKQWASLASYHNSIEKYGTAKVDALVLNLTKKLESDIEFPDKESKKYWNKKIRD